MTFTNHEAQTVDALYVHDFLYPTMSYQANINIFAPYNANSAQSEFLPIETHGKTKITRLSTGQRKLAAITILARRQAPIVLLDEVSNGLDRTSRARCEEYITSVAEHGPTAVLLTGHDLDFMNKVANRALTVCDGAITDRTELLDVGATIEEIYAQHCA